MREGKEIWKLTLFSSYHIKNVYYITRNDKYFFRRLCSCLCGCCCCCCYIKIRYDVSKFSWLYQIKYKYTQITDAFEEATQKKNDKWQTRKKKKSKLNKENQIFIHVCSFLLSAKSSYWYDGIHFPFYLLLVCDLTCYWWLCLIRKKCSLCDKYLCFLYNTHTRKSTYEKGFVTFLLNIEKFLACNQ